MKARNADKEVAKVIQNLKKIRKEKDVSHEMLGKKTDLSRTTIGAIENGRSSPTLRTIIRICDALDIKPSELLKQIGR